MSTSWSRKVSGHFWTKESGMTSMLILLCISNFVITPFFTRQQSLHFLVRVIWFLLLVAGITTLSRNRSRMRIFSIIPILLVVLVVIRFFWDNQILDYFEFIIDLATFSLLIGMVLIKVFESGPVTIHRVIGAVVVYMLIGDVWAIMFQFINVHLPGSFQVPDSFTNTGISTSTFLYFSYTTLSTTGYGEIVPLHALPRTLVTIEQLIGVLYPVILLGRLVSLYAGNNNNSGKG